MKKIIGFVCIALMAFTSNAQHTTPRFGTAPNQNRTFSSVGFKTYAIADAALLDTVKISPNAYQNEYVLTLTDTCVLAFSSIGDSYKFDKMTVIIENTSGSNHFVYFLGLGSLATKWRMASTGTTATLASAKAAVFTFEFNGAFWYEVSRCIQ